MARFYPETFLEKVMPDGIAKNGLLYDNLSIKKRYLRALYKVAGREGKALKETVLEVIAYYAKREEKLGTQALLTQRIENFLVWNKVQEEKEAHAGQYYRWLPSDAQNPDPEHQLNYGKIFREGDGHEMPGERYGCRCGIEWLSDEEAFTEFAGKEWTGYKGQKAVRKLLKEQQGYVPNAFYRKDTGPISLIWGDKEKGMAHWISRRNSQGIDTKEFLKDFARVISKGEKFPNKKAFTRFNIWHKKYRKMIVLETTYGKKKITWPITAVKQKRKP